MKQADFIWRDKHERAQREKQSSVGPNGLQLDFISDSGLISAYTVCLPYFNDDE